LLARHGHDVGEIDGIIGELTRQAIRKAQLKYRLPADSYPSAELIARLKSDS
jgi:peptidoglycan hydrolase-like protein with peptidoglycan-binding domain